MVVDVEAESLEGEENRVDFLGGLDLVDLVVFVEEGSEGENKGEEKGEEKGDYATAEGGLVMDLVAEAMMVAEGEEQQVVAATRHNATSSQSRSTCKYFRSLRPLLPT